VSEPREKVRVGHGFLSCVRRRTVVSFIKRKHTLREAQKLSMVVYACNPSYSGGRCRRITSSKPAQAKLLKPFLKKKR
jgi:hypothetical protein